VSSTPSAFSQDDTSNATNTLGLDMAAMDPFRLLTQGANFHKKSALFKQKKPTEDEDDMPAASTSRLDAPLPAALDFFNVGAGARDVDGAGEGKGKRKREDRPVQAGQSTASFSRPADPRSSASSLPSASRRVGAIFQHLGMSASMSAVRRDRSHAHK
jgi:hypothetical protein